MRSGNLSNPTCGTLFTDYMSTPLTVRMYGEHGAEFWRTKPRGAYALHQTNPRSKNFDLVKTNPTQRRLVSQKVLHALRGLYQITLEGSSFRELEEAAKGSDGKFG